MANLAVIPARGGSKGVPGKNVKVLAGKPLIAWTIEQALASDSIDTVLLSTDDETIAAVARDHGADVPFLRPAELATDEALTEPVMTHALDWYAADGQAFDTVTLLQPTSPLRLAGTIDAAFRQFREEGADSLIGVVANHHFYWRRGAGGGAESLTDYRNRPRRQDIAAADRLYRETGSIYISRVDAFRRSGNRVSGSIALFVMDELEGSEIDSETDFAILETLFSRISDAD
jgi:CMP-N,N'-diacetyllegionaminic acid synthase